MRKLLDGFRSVTQFVLKLLDSFFKLVLNPGLSLRHSFGNGLVLFSEDLDFLLQLGYFQFVFADLFLKVIDFFGVSIRLDERLYFLLQFFVDFQVLLHSFFKLLVLFLVKVYVFNIVLEYELR